MTQDQFFRFVVDLLESQGIEYFITGSVAAMAYSTSRTTEDIDVVIAMEPWMAARLVELLDAADFYVDGATAEKAARDRDMFNAIHRPSGYKIDFMVPPESSFERARFHRKRRLEVADGGVAFFASPEDVIIKKLVYFDMSEQDKHLSDSAKLVQAVGEDLDLAYIAGWCSNYGLLDYWHAILDRLGEPHD